MSKLIQEIRMQMTGMRHAIYDPLVSVSVIEHEDALCRQDIMDEYEVVVNIGQTIRCYKGDKQAAFDNVCSSINDLIYKEFYARLLQVELAWFERDNDKIESGIRDLFRLIGSRE